jgi:hypothetical protein
MSPIIYAIHNVGNKYHQEIPWRYSGLTVKDPSMKQYDGFGFAVRRETPTGTDEKHFLSYEVKLKTEKQGGWHFACGDSRTSAFFLAEPYGLADVGWFTPYYRKQMKILEKVKAEPGMSHQDIPRKFTKWENEEVYPPLTPLILGFLVEELVLAGLIQVVDGKLFAKVS